MTAVAKNYDERAKTARNLARRFWHALGEPDYYANNETLRDWALPFLSLLNTYEEKRIEKIFKWALNHKWYTKKIQLPADLETNFTELLGAYDADLRAKNLKAEKDKWFQFTPEPPRPDAEIFCALCMKVGHRTSHCPKRKVAPKRVKAKSIVRPDEVEPL